MISAGFDIDLSWLSVEIAYNLIIIDHIDVILHGYVSWAQYTLSVFMAHETGP